jgi:hypothetical protein
MAHLLQNLRVGRRGLRRTPAFAVTAVLTLAVGIGLATAVFAVAEALLLRHCLSTTRSMWWCYGGWPARRA